MLDVEALSEMMAGIIAEEVEKAVAPLHARIAELESRPVGSQMGDIKGVVEVMISDALVTRSVNQSTVEKLIADEIAKIKPAKELDREEMANLVNDAVAALPPAQDGKSVEIEDVLPVIASEVAKAVEQLPTPKDGRDGRDGKDAAGFVDVVKDNGELVVTLQDGRLLRTGIRDGVNGKDGEPGPGLDDYDEWLEDDGRVLVRQCVIGEGYKQFRHTTATVLDRGVFIPDRAEPYEKGDSVTWGGQTYIAQETTNLKPDLSKDGKPWRLSVRKGRDGKDFKPKDPA